MGWLALDIATLGVAHWAGGTAKASQQLVKTAKASKQVARNSAKMAKTTLKIATETAITGSKISKSLRIGNTV